MSAVHNEIWIAATDLEPERKLCFLKAVFKSFPADVHALKTERINSSSNCLRICLLKQAYKGKLRTGAFLGERIISFRRVDIRAVVLKSIILYTTADLFLIFRKNDSLAVFGNAYFVSGNLRKGTAEVFFMIDGNVCDNRKNTGFFKVCRIICAAHSGLQNDEVTSGIRKKNHAQGNGKLEFGRILFFRKTAADNL